MNKKPLLIIAAVVVIGIGGVLAYAISQNKSDGMDMSQMHQDGKGGQQSTSDATKTDMVEIKSYAFSPQTITVKAGTKVTWTNQDDVKHTVTSDDGAPVKIASELFGKGESFSFTFDKVGTYNYHCLPHPYMKGTVIVTE